MISPFLEGLFDTFTQIYQGCVAGTEAVDANEAIRDKIN